jgi:acetyltransferase
VDALIVVMTVIRTYSELINRLREQPAAAATDVVFVNTGGDVAREASRSLQRLGYPVFESVAAAVGAVADAASDSSVGSTRPSSRRPIGSSTEILDLDELGPVPEEALFPLLGCYGVRAAAWRLANSGRDARRASVELGLPVVVKALARQARHKSDLGAIATELRSARAVETAFRSISDMLRAKGLEGQPLLVQRQVELGLELLVGGRTDIHFGPVVTVAYGGVLAEVLHQSVTRLAPVSIEAARQMVLALPRADVFAAGYRGQPAHDFDALAETVAGVSALVAALAERGLSAELDLNPVIVLSEGEGCVAVDALLEITELPTARTTAPEAAARRKPGRGDGFVPGVAR